VIDSIPVLLTIFAVARNQYFYLGEPLLDRVITAGLDVQNMLLTNELADAENAGMVGGLLATIYCLAAPFSGVLGNQVFGLFSVSLSDRANFIADTSDFRSEVAISFAITWGLSIASLGLLPFLPNQKKEAQQRMRDWPSHRCYAYTTLAALAIALAWQLLVEFISMDPTLSCSKFVGGQGC
ncbi:unnamed protein product, partial [Polarella glacialis]